MTFSSSLRYGGGIKLICFVPSPLENLSIGTRRFGSILSIKTQLFRSILSIEPQLFTHGVLSIKT